MATLYLDRRDLELRADGGALALYEAGERRGSVPIGMLERVVARCTVRLDTRVLGALAERGVGLVALSPRHGRRTAMLVGLPHNDAARRLSQYRAYLDGERRRAWSRELVAAKLHAQHRLLARALRGRPDQRKSLTDAIARLDRLLARLRNESVESLPLDTLRGIEGAGAAAYFGGYTSVFPASVEFTGRNRRPPRDPVNACLSLGYTLLHAEAVFACHAAGLDPLLGLYHEPAFGRESLAADVIEPLRPHIDEWVWELFRERILTLDHFRRDNGICLLGKAGRQHFYERYETFARGLRRLLRRQLGRLAHDLAKEGIALFLRAEDDEEREP